MAVLRGQAIDGQFIANANSVIYDTTSLGNGATRGVITSATMYATSAVAGVSLYIVPSGGSPDGSNQILNKDFAVGEEYSVPELIGQSVISSSSLQGNDGGNGGANVNIVITVTEFTGDS